MEIQQHDGVVVDAAGCRQGFAELIREREVLQGRGGGCAPSRVPTPRGAAALDGGGSQEGERGARPRVGLRPICA